jgi:KTSC domain-containing protein
MNGQEPPAEPKLPPIQSVDSSHIEGAGHDPVGKTLFIAFRDKSLYAYQGVTAGTYQALLVAKSPGQFFNERIKGAYKGFKIKDKPPKVPEKS